MPAIINVIIILSVLLIIITVLADTLNKSVSESFNSKKYTLGLLVCAKNESMVIDEFIKHYKWQGVEQIYLIDNGSTDDMHLKLVPYIQEGYVQYFMKPEKHQQERHYNDVYSEVARSECQWLIVCDCDEYVYHRQKGASVKDYLMNLPYDEVGMVTLNWKMFGSSGYVDQPRDIRTSFVHRASEIHQNTKVIINTKYVNVLHIHWHDMTEEKKVIYQPPELALNHYAIMSKEYFQNVKMTRGAADTMNYEHLRDWTYFEKYDTNDTYDGELAELVKLAASSAS